MAKSLSLSKVVIKNALEFLSVGERIGSRSTFDHALWLSHSRILPENLRYEEQSNSFSYRLKTRPNLCFGKDDEVTLGTYLALIDSITTAHIVAANFKRSCLPGVSVHMEANRLSDITTPRPDEVDIISKLTKVGKVMAFCRAEIRSTNTGKLICSGSQVKYLPSGSIAFDIALSPYLWPATKLFFMNRQLPQEDRTERLEDVILPHLRHTSVGQGNFIINSSHTNPFGMFHGGCQSVLMEMVGANLAKQELKASRVHLVSLSINFQSAGKNEVNIEAEVLMPPTQDGYTTLVVRVRLVGESRPISEGTLRFRRLEPNPVL